MKFQGSCEGTSDGTPWCFCSCVEYVVKSADSAGFVLRDFSENWEELISLYSPGLFGELC